MAQGSVQVSAEREDVGTLSHAGDGRDTVLGKEGEDEGQTGRDRRSSSHRGTVAKGQFAVFGLCYNIPLA